MSQWPGEIRRDVLGKLVLDLTMKKHQGMLMEVKGWIQGSRGGGLRTQKKGRHISQRVHTQKNPRCRRHPGENVFVLEVEVLCNPGVSWNEVFQVLAYPDGLGSKLCGSLTFSPSQDFYKCWAFILSVVSASRFLILVRLPLVQTHQPRCYTQPLPWILCPHKHTHTLTHTHRKYSGAQNILLSVSEVCGSMRK